MFANLVRGEEVPDNFDFLFRRFCFARRQRLENKAADVGQDRGVLTLQFPFNEKPHKIDEKWLDLIAAFQFAGFLEEPVGAFAGVFLDSALEFPDVDDAEVRGWVDDAVVAANASFVGVAAPVLIWESPFIMQTADVC